MALDCLAHAGLWDGVFDGNLLIGFARFDSVKPGEGIGDIAQEGAVNGFRGVAQNELGLDAASTQAERRVDAECVLANAIGPIDRQAANALRSSRMDTEPGLISTRRMKRSRLAAEALSSSFHYYRDTARLERDAPRRVSASSECGPARPRRSVLPHAVGRGARRSVPAWVRADASRRGPFGHCVG